jgi:hypothetical protein
MRLKAAAAPRTEEARFGLRNQIVLLRMALPEGLREPVPGSRFSLASNEKPPFGVQNCSRQFCRTLYEGSHGSASGSFARLRMALPEGFEPSYQP